LGRLVSRALVIDFAAVRNSRDTHELRFVVDDVHHAPIANSHAPLVFVASEFLASGRGSSARDSILLITRPTKTLGKASSSFRAEGLSST